MPVVAGVGGSGVFSAASGGKVYAYNNISEFAQLTVAPQNTGRQRILFHNPGNSDVFISPVNVQNVIGTVPSSANGQPKLVNTPITPTNLALGGVFRVFGNGGTLEIQGECQNAWQALSVTGAGAANPLTVLDSNS